MINTLLMMYAEHVDAGRFGDVAAMFEHSTYRIEHGDGAHVSHYEGSAPVQAFCEQTRTVSRRDAAARSTSSPTW